MNMVFNSVYQGKMITLFGCDSVNMIKQFFADFGRKKRKSVFCAPNDMKPDFMICLTHCFSSFFYAVNGVLISDGYFIFPSPEGLGYFFGFIFSQP